ncbi:hypothetical protein [Sinorhizobium psoraleae]|uniref:Uncharacterized protein n=1 Tax=Sinorhizobium psoraleae TaxID=520838 RepID=A0ABT4K9T1_9HYPH|nr:hypothetical protein [Sinorhizobium psoraleae]MCZ4088713.1 hypothetical protein [Sinorhizobium psoraleae]
MPILFILVAVVFVGIGVGGGAILVISEVIRLPWSSFRLEWDFVALLPVIAIGFGVLQVIVLYPTLSLRGQGAGRLGFRIVLRAITCVYLTFSALVGLGPAQSSLGALVGNWVGLFYWPSLMGLGTLRSYFALTSDGGQLACTVAAEAGAAIRELNLGDAFAEVFLWPARHLDKTIGLMGFVQQHTWSEFDTWKSSINIITYATTTGMIMGCAMGTTALLQWIGWGIGGWLMLAILFTVYELVDDKLDDLRSWLRRDRDD